MPWDDVLTSVEEAKKLARPMDYATLDITYHQMANAARWRLSDDVMLRAQATLVNFHHKLKLSSYWGDGKDRAFTIRHWLHQQLFSIAAAKCQLNLVCVVNNSNRIA